MTSSRFKTLVLISGWILLAGSISAPAQDAPATGEESTDASQETDVNEDNYRRFMELRDQQRQRATAPYAALAPPSNLQKMNELPEESQKYLRNQLLGIILEGERWTPEQAGKTYPYVPSEAARTDANLRNMEAEAWSELIQNYHARESKIYQAGERARSATVAEQAGEDGARAESSTTVPGSSETSLQRATGGASGSAATNASEPGQRQAGVTQSALEYLTGAGTAASSAEPPKSSDGQTPQGNSDQVTQTRRAAEGAPDAGSAPKDASAAMAGNPANAAQASQSGSSTSDAPSASQTATQAAAQSASQMAQAETGAQAPDASSSAAQEAASSMAANSADDASSQSESAQASSSPKEVVYESAGVIAIKDLDKVQGTGSDDKEKKKDKED
jgi:hypothetical protein